MNNTLVVYHRCGGKTIGMPPNTLYAAQWAKDYGAQAIEYDVAIAKKDNGFEVFLIEPALLKRAGLDINNLSWDDVKNIDTGNSKSGSMSPSLLVDTLQTIGNSVAHQIQIKGHAAETVVEVAKSINDFENYIITAFDMDVIKEIKSIDQKIPVGWLVKPTQESGDEAGVDLTAKLVAEADALEEYSDDEVKDIINICKENRIEIALLCGPRINSQTVVETFHAAGLAVGAWGVAANLELAQRLISFGIDRFTLDNPEQLETSI